jgi:hypothetical protein
MEAYRRKAHPKHLKAQLQRNVPEEEDLQIEGVL